MARIRTIKPEFFTNSKVTKLTPLARLFYVSLWCESDREGRLKWDPDTLKDRYLPRDKCDVAQMGDDLSSAGLIRFYEIGGKMYVDIPGFLEHQVINNREGPSTIPPYSDDACVTRESGDTHAACGKEGRKGREGKEGTTPIVPRGDEPEKFKSLMEAYPKRQGTNPRTRALQAWERVIAAGADPDQLIEAARAYAKTDVAGTQFTQQTASWLNGGSWKETPAPAEVTILNPELSQWAARRNAWDERGVWMRDLWGPAPGEPGCKMPAELITRTKPAGMVA